MNFNVTFLIVTFKSYSVIHNCLQSIPKGYPILVVENSSDENFKKELENSYKNLECILCYENLGYGKANNIGLRKAKTKYVFLLNPDTILKSDTLENIQKTLKKIKNFSLLAPIVETNNKGIEFLNYGFFKNETENDFKYVRTFEDFFEVDFVKGAAMFFNKDEFKDLIFFDENIFFYWEDTEICLRLKKNFKHIYVIRAAKIFHSGGKSHDEDVNHEMEISKNWHLMWSQFYLRKKYTGTHNAYLKSFKDLVKSFLKFFILYFFNKKKSLYAKARFNGLIAAYHGKNSSFGPKVN